MGVTSDVQRRRAISSRKFVYSSSLSWTRLSWWNDYPLMASKRCWSSALLKRWLSNSGAALVPSVAASLLNLFAKSFLGGISCEDNIWKVSLQEIYQSLQTRAKKHFIWRECQHALYKIIILGPCYFITHMHLYT